MHAPFDTSVIQRLFTQLSHNRICDLHMQNRPYFARKGPHISTKLGHTHTRTSETLYQSAPKSNAFISRHHPSSKLALKWWSFIKAATARKNSIVISVLREDREEAQRRIFFFPLSVDWLRIFHKMVYAAGGTGFGGWLGVSFCSSQYIHRIMTQFLASLKELWIETVIEGRYEEMYFSTYLL